MNTIEIPSHLIRAKVDIETDKFDDDYVPRTMSVIRNGVASETKPYSLFKASIRWVVCEDFQKVCNDVIGPHEFIKCNFDCSVWLLKASDEDLTLVKLKYF